MSHLENKTDHGASRSEDSQAGLEDFPQVLLGGAPLPLEEAKQLAYTVRILLTSMKGNDSFTGEIPAAYDVRMYGDGSIVLKAFQVPQGVVMAEETTMPAPLLYSNQRLARGRQPNLEALEEQRRKERRHPSGVPEFEGEQRRVIDSNNGLAEVYE